MPGAKLPVGPSKRRDRGPLTPREEEVAAKIASGTPSKIIADEMGITEDTLKQHVTHIYNKVGCDNRAGLTEWWMRREFESTLQDLRSQLSAERETVLLLQRRIEMLTGASETAA